LAAIEPQQHHGRVTIDAPVEHLVIRDRVQNFALIAFDHRDGVLLKPLPYPDSKQLVALWLDAPGAAGLSNFEAGLRLSPSMYFTFAENNHAFQSLGVWVPSTANVTGIAQPEQVKSLMISDGILQTLDIPAAAGRWFSARDQDPRGSKTVILSYGYWMRRFGGDRGAIGRSIQLDSQTCEIVGVMPRGFRVVDRDFVPKGNARYVRGFPRCECQQRQRRAGSVLGNGDLVGELGVAGNRQHTGGGQADG